MIRDSIQNADRADLIALIILRRRAIQGSAPYLPLVFKKCNKDVVKKPARE